MLKHKPREPLLPVGIAWLPFLSCKQTVSLSVLASLAKERPAGP